MSEAAKARLPFRREEFDPAWYLATYPDVRAAGIDPWAHYAADGHREGRLGGPVRTLELDHVLWRGFAAQALPELRLLLRRGAARERAVAGWVVARHAAAQARWQSARAAIELFHAFTEGRAIIAHPGPWLLGAKACAMCGDMARARRLLTEAGTRFGADSDIALARLDLAVAQGQGDDLLIRALGGVHAGTGLAPVTLEPGDAPPFDRLTTGPVAPVSVEDGPLVSVIVPAFRAEATLGTCLRSLRAQSWRNLEIIVVDDASPDGTAGIAERAALADPRVRVIQQPVNGGAYIARNTGLAAAQGAFLTVQDADDWAHPCKIEEQLRPLLESDTPMASVSHWVRSGSDLSMTLWRIEQGWVYRNVSSLMMRRSLRETLGFWDRVRANADTEYYHRLIAAHGDAAVTEVHPGVPLAFGRNAPQSLTLAKATHLATQFRGPRRAYLEAALFWQSQSRAPLETAAEQATAEDRARTLYLPEHPARRAFPAPAELGPADPPPPPDDYARIAGSDRFDPLWYLARNPDVLAADVDPVRHYLESGGVEGRDPGPGFSGSAWQRIRQLDAGTIPLLDREALPASATAPPPRFAGARAAGERPVALVFAHGADAQIFGAERSLLRALERLAEGHDGPALDPVVVLPSAINGAYLDEVRARSVCTEILPQLWRHRFRPPHPQTIAAIREMIRRHRPAELHVNTLVLDAPLVAARLEGCPTVVHVRELPAEDAGLCRILGDSAHGLRRSVLAQADRFIANSPAVAAWLDCPDRVRLHPNEVDPALFEMPFTPASGLRVALVSSNIAKKGVADFIAVAHRVAETEARDEVPEERRCRFLLIGPPSADLALLGPLPGNTEHAGYAKGPVAAMEQTDLVLVLSHFAESFGRTTLEAMAAGRPVICYDRGTPPSLIRHGRTGFAVPPGDVDAVMRTLRALATARLGLLDMSRQARARALRLHRGDFDPDIENGEAPRS